MATATLVAASSGPFVVVLGIGQDAGVPQIGCDTPFCRRAWRDPSLRQTVASIALVDPDGRRRWIFDATPDLPEQFEFLKTITGDRSNSLDGIFLTHAHMGHYTGLMYFGRESMNAAGIKVYAMPRMRSMLERNAPWSQLVSLNNIALVPLTDRQGTDLGGISVEPFLVPHRDELSETVGYRISRAGRSLVYIPDIDKWDRWPTNLADVVRAADHVVIDGTFFADGEIDRPMKDIPHPFVSETMSLLEAMSAADRAKVVFIHFNHSNPLVQGDRKALAEVRRRGFRVAVRGMRLAL